MPTKRILPAAFPTNAPTNSVSGQRLFYQHCEGGRDPPPTIPHWFLKKRYYHPRLGGLLTARFSTPPRALIACVWYKGAFTIRLSRNASTPGDSPSSLRLPCFLEPQFPPELSVMILSPALSATPLSPVFRKTHSTNRVAYELCNFTGKSRLQGRTIWGDGNERAMKTYV